MNEIKNYKEEKELQLGRLNMLYIRELYLLLPMLVFVKVTLFNPAKKIIHLHLISHPVGFFAYTFNLRLLGNFA